MRDFTELDSHPTNLIRRLNQIAVAQFADAMARQGTDLTPAQYCVLAALAATPGIDQATLAGTIGYDRATTGKVLDRMEAKELVSRAPRPSDRRAKVLALTVGGVALFRSVRPLVEDIQTVILQGLSDSEKDTLTHLMQKATLTANSLSRAPKAPMPAV